MSTATNLEAGGTNTRGDANGLLDYLKSLPGNQVSDDLMAEIASRLVVWLNTGDEGTLTFRVAEVEKDLAAETVARTDADTSNREEVDSDIATLTATVAAQTVTLAALEARVLALEEA